MTSLTKYAVSAGHKNMDQVITYYLEMRSPSLLKESSKHASLDIFEVEDKQFELNKSLYKFVGEAWTWVDKLSWSDEQWKAYLENENVRTWVAYSKGATAGYYELIQSGKGDTEIAYFGLTPNFIGLGFGGYLLSEAIKSAWAWGGTERVWVHTCTLDHPGALKNYQARGMEIYREETENK